MKKGDDYDWESTTTLPTSHFDCGHCGADVSSDTGYRGTFKVPAINGHSNERMYIYICHSCSKPNFFDRKRVQSPVRYLVEENFPEHIVKISPEFVETYNQALSAEELKFDRIAGPGYRRALEFLIKDFAISEDAAHADEIRAKHLGPCITDHVQNERIKATARGATYIGNDETHYTRIWITKDIQDLKKFIHTVVYWVEAEVTTKEMQEEMGV